MKSLMRDMAAVGAVLVAAAGSPAAAGGINPEFFNSKVVVVEQQRGDGGYWKTRSSSSYDENAQKWVREPIDPSRIPIRDAMMKRRVLEEYVEFLSPVRWPRVVRVIASDCFGGDADSAYYDSNERRVNLCYGYVGDFAKFADDVIANKNRMKMPKMPISREQLIAAEVAATVMHESGHLLIDILDIPVFGREEDAADQVEAFLAVQFAPEVARTIIEAEGIYWQWDANINKYGGDKKSFNAYADTHGSASQRLYNILCIAYGGAPSTFQDLVDGGLLPASRAGNCKNEYSQAYAAFRDTVYPFLDQAQMAKVKARKDWFLPSETMPPK